MASRLTNFLKLFIPDLYDKGTVVTDVFEPNFEKIDQNAKNVDDKIKKLNQDLENQDNDKLNKGTLPATITNAEKIFKVLQGNTGIKFDENLLYLNDEGTKNVGFCYLDRLTDGIFECIQETTTTVNNATYFKNFSNKENSDRLSNFCPFPVNSLYISLGNENPSTLWLGTTWQKQENRFLLGAGSSYGLGSTGGSATVKLSIDNLPSHNHSASTASHTHSQPTHTHTISGLSSETGGNASWYLGNGQFNRTGTTSASGGDTTGSASPTISIGYTGSGTAFSIMPPYLVVNIWKRTS